MNGKTKKIIQWTAGVIFSLLIIFVILISSFEIVLYSDMSVYRKEYEKYEVLDELDMTMDDAMYVTREMMDYLRGDKETLSVITEVEGKRQDFFNEQDRFHMREVRDIFAGGLRLRTAALVAAAVSLLILYMCRADVKKILPQTYQVAVGIVLIPTAGIGIAAAIDFNSVFVQFHNIFFDNDLWLFDPAEDFMIRMLPEGLFYDMAFRVGSLFAGILVILFLLSLYMRWRENSRKVKEKTGKKKGYDFLIQQRRTFEREKTSFHLFQICLELAEAFQEYEELGRYFLKLAKKNSEILPKLALMNEKYDRWMFGEQEIENSEELRKKLQDCYLRLLRLRYVYGHTK